MSIEVNVCVDEQVLLKADVSLFLNRRVFYLVVCMRVGNNLRRLACLQFVAINQGAKLHFQRKQNDLELKCLYILNKFCLH